MPVDPDKVKALFFDALAQSDPAARAALLDAACASDAELRRRVEALLEAHEKPGEFLEKPAAAPVVTGDSNNPAPALFSPHETAHFAPPTETAGMRIGHYKLLQQIGEGGMGTVWMAEQTEPVKRMVALKVIKAGMDSDTVIARFEAERQALALMDHPNIAKVLDANTTNTGRPYFVMELVKGIPITKYCDERRLSPRERLELFIPVCQAIQHAHQKGVIHRDLKPSNVLVALYDGRPVPKVIDFGVAKAVNQKLTEKTMFTAFGALVGTLEYMSPEQAELNALDIDTRSDLYSLGVLLYELLTGTTPLERKRLKEGAFLDVLRRIREEEPPRPSTRLSSSAMLPSVAAQRGTDPARLTRQMRGDLDWIVMKCLEKDRSRRYETANGLAMDLQRHLQDEPVLAGPPTARYRLRKFVRRHRVGVLVGVVVVLLLVGGVTGTTLGLIAAQRSAADARRSADDARQAEQLAETRLLDADRERHHAEKEKERADEEAEVARAVNDFVQTALLAQASPYQQQGADHLPDPDIKLRLVLDRASDRIEGRFAEQPLVEAGLRDVIGTAYLDLGEYHRAEPHLQRARALQEEHRGPRHPDTLTAQFRWATLLDKQGQYKEAESLLRDVLEQRQALLKEDHKDTVAAMILLAQVLVSRVNYPEAEKLLLRAEALLEKKARTAADFDPLQPFAVTHNLALLYQLLGRYDRANALFERALAGMSARVGPDHPDALLALSDLAKLDMVRGDYPVAETRLTRVHAGLRKTLGENHPETLLAARTLGELHQTVGRYDRADTLMTEALKQARATLGEDHPATLQIANNLGLLRLDQGKLEETERLFAAARKRSVARLGDDHPTTLALTNNLAQALRVRGKYDEAKGLYAETYRRLSDRLGEDHPNTLTVLGNQARLSQAVGEYAEAEKLFRRELKARHDKFGDDHPDTFQTVAALARVLLARGQFDEASKLFTDALDRSRRKLGADHPDTLLVQEYLGHLLLAQGKADEAEQKFRDALAGFTAKVGERHPQCYALRNDLGWLYLVTSKLDKAEPLLVEALAGLRTQLDEHHPDVLNVAGNLGILYFRQGKLAEGEALLAKALAGLRATVGDDHPKTLMAMSVVGEACRRQGKLDKAEPLLRKAVERMPERLGVDHQETLWAMSYLVQLDLETGKYEEAETLSQKLLDLRTKKLGGEHLETLQAAFYRALAYQARGKLDLAEQEFERLLAAVRGKVSLDNSNFVTLVSSLMSVYLERSKPEKAEAQLLVLREEMRKQLAEDNPAVSVVLAFLGMARLQMKKYPEAEEVLRECQAIRKKTMRDTWYFYSSESLLGAALAGQKKYADAEPLLLDAYEGLKKHEKNIPPGSRVRITEAGQRLVQLYEAWDKKDKADEWRKKLAPPKE